MHNRLLRKQLKLRFSQLFINEKYKGGSFKIPIHLALGYESIATALDEVVLPEDSMFLTHRNIHYNLLRIESLKLEIDEYLLKPSGIAGGRLGSMNFANPKKGILYSSSILGNNLAVGTGYALANKAKKKKGIVFIVTGDGAIEEGSFWETLLFLKSNELRAIIVIENNTWSLGTKITERRCAIELGKLCSSMSIPYSELKGNDCNNYIAKISEIRDLVNQESIPCVLEVHTTGLGYRIVESNQLHGERYINYHAGPITHLTLENYPIIEKTEKDPIYVSSLQVESDTFLKTSEEIRIEVLKDFQ